MAEGSVTGEEATAALIERGITNERVIEGLLIAFDRDHSGNLSHKEFDQMLKRVDEFIALPEAEDETPPDCKAIISLAKTNNDPSTKLGNPRLKMFLTSAGLMPGSSKTFKDSFNASRAKTSGKGVLYLIDARLNKLQFHLQAGKSQEELMNMGQEGYAGVAYNLRHRGHYANGDIAELTGGVEDTPVYVAYLWYNGEVADGKFVHNIFLAKGAYQGGRFCALRADGDEFAEDDYNLFSKYSSSGDHWFSEVSGDAFAKVFDEVQVVYATGGIPFIPILHFQPEFVDETGQVANAPNPYGRAILDAVKAGNVTYVGMSAGAMAWGWTMGPLTTDPQRFMLHDNDAEDTDGAIVEVRLGKELGRKWLFPGLGEYVGIPYDITLKAHVHFSPETCSFQGTAAKAEKVATVVCAIANKDQHAALLTDYDWYAGQGDLLEICDGKLFYHVGFCAKEDPLPEEWQEHLQAETIRRQPAGVPEEGFKFEWTPAAGEVIASGPKATHQPFRMYADSNGPFADHPPSFSG